MKGYHLEAAGLVAAVGVMMLAGCGGGAGSAATSPRGTGSPSSSQPRHGANSFVQEESMRIEITIEGQRFQATLDDSPASRDLLAQLP